MLPFALASVEMFASQALELEIKLNLSKAETSILPALFQRKWI